MSENAALASELNAARQIVDKFRIQGLSEDELRQLNPAVATTIASLKRGRSLTEIYSDYVQIVEERDLLKLDKERLTEHIREMMAQLEEKAPLLRSQQDAYFKGKDRIAELQTQLEAATNNAKTKQEIAEDQRRRAGYFQRQNILLKQSCRDLSLQVKTLLCELETARGIVITSTEDTDIQVFPDSSTNDLDSRTLLELCSTENSSAAAVIDNNLVTFRSLSDLQTQNTRLLIVARDLATQLESHESKKDILADQVSDITTKVEVLSGEVEVARLATSEARFEANFAARQRDAYRALLQRHSISLPDFPVHDESTLQRLDELSANSQDNALALAHLDQSASALDRTGGSSQSLHQSQTIVKLEETLCSLHSEFKRYREDKLKSDEVYTVTIEKLRTESTEARILNQKLAAQLDFTHEKFRTLESNVANYKQEITILREMNARYTTSAAASDEALTALREQAARSSDRLASAEIECRQLIRQLEYTRANEARLSQELETAQKTALMHEHLMNQLQSIQSNLEHREDVEARLAARRTETLENELEALKKSSAAKQDRLFILNTTLQSELSNSRQALRSAEEEIAQLQAAIASAQSSPPTSDTGTSGSQAQALSSSNEVPPASTDFLSAGGSQALTTQLRNLERECASLRVSLEAVRKQCVDYQRLGNEMETHIAELTKEHEHIEHTHAAEIGDISQRCELLSLQLALEKTERQDLIHEKTHLTEEYQISLKKLCDDLNVAQLALKDAEERREIALKVETSARSEVAAHQRTAQEAREKYEMELRLHSQDVELLVQARKVAEEARAEIEGLQFALETANATSKQAEERFTMQSNLWEELRTRLVKRVDDADVETNRLQEQILKLTEQIVNLRKLMERSTDQSFICEESSGQIREAEDFAHLLDYLRRQKSIAEAAEESANAEVSRLHMRTKTLEMQVADLQAKLAEERQKSELRLETSSQHATLMKQIEQVNLLNESNRLLRQERELIRDASIQAEEKLAVLRMEMEPLRVQCKDLQDIREILMVEKRSLAEERDRWKERCTRLVETSKRMDPKEYKQACDARDEFQARLEAVVEAKATAERESSVRIASLEQQLSDLSSSLAQHESESQTFTAKLASLQEQSKIQEDELFKRQVKITKLREIGRKYRQEADELKRQLSNTLEKEESLKTTEETIVAVRVDLLNAQANLQIEQEQSSLLRQEIDNIQHLINQVESLPGMDRLRHVSVESLIGINSTIPSPASGTYNHLNHLLSTLIAEFLRMRSESEEQSERLLRMQLIESQLAKTRRQCIDLKAQLTSVMTTASSEAIGANNSVPLDSTVTQASKAVDQQTLSPELTSSTPVVKAPSSTTLGSSSWGVRAAVTVQPVQTPPPPTLSPGPLSAAARQTAEIRPLPNLVATVLPTPTTGVIMEPPGCSSYLLPLITQHVDSTATVIGGFQTTESQSLSSASTKSIVRYPSSVQPTVVAPITADDQSGILHRCPAVTKRTYEEAIFSNEEQAGTLENETTLPPLTSVLTEMQESKRAKSAALPLIPPATTSVTSPLASVINTEAKITENLEDWNRVDQAVEVTENSEKAEEDDDEEDEDEDEDEEKAEEKGQVEQAPQFIDFREYGEGDNEMEYAREVHDGSCLIIDAPRDYLQQINQIEEEEEENESTVDEKGQTDYEAEYDDAENDEVDEEEQEGGTNNPVIILSSDDEEEEDDDEEEEEEGEEDESNVEEEEEDGVGVQSGEEEMESQEEDIDGDEDVEDEAIEGELAEGVPPTITTTSQNISLFSQSGNAPSAILFSSSAPSTTGGLFSNLNPSVSTDPKPASLFGGMAIPTSRNTFASVSTPSQSHCGSFIRPATIPGPSSVPPKQTTSDVGETASGVNKQKIHPIVWTESSDVSRKHPTPSCAPTPSLFGPSSIGGVLGRRKNWGPFGGGVSRGSPRGGHR